MNALSIGFFVILVFLQGKMLQISCSGSMSSIAVSYGAHGPSFCGLQSDGSHLVTCNGSDSSITYASPSRFQFYGLTAGDGFVCGLLIDTNQPYCWGNNIYIQMGVPQPMIRGTSYTEISAGDHHLCGLRTRSDKNFHGRSSTIDCWGYNMTGTYEFQGEIKSITAGFGFNCGLFLENKTAFCWGDESESGVISLMPKHSKFQMIAAGGFHVCGILEDLRAVCWGKSLSLEEGKGVSLGQGNVDFVPGDYMISVVGGRFHACGIRKIDHRAICWGVRLQGSTLPPGEAKVYALAAGDYFTCGILTSKSHQVLCWGSSFPTSLPMAVLPGVCVSTPCSSGYYASTKLCNLPNSRFCLPCSNACPNGMFMASSCSDTADRVCQFDCLNCVSPECSKNCSLVYKKKHFSSFQMTLFIGELIFAITLVLSVSLIATLYVRYKLKKCGCSKTQTKDTQGKACSVQKESAKIRPDFEEMKIRRAQMFTYEELYQATDGFSEDSTVGKGSFSCVFKGVLKDGTVVAVKRAIIAPDLKKSSKEFHTELDLLSRLNHAHLLNLLGYCEEGGERLLVYEFMANGSLHQHLHGKNPSLKEKLDWVRRVTIAVQAARGIEYLHGYACPPVIHRDIKSSNILIDEEHNARVADFGLSLLGPADSSSPLSELPAGTLGYLDPEYYRLHYLTTKSDVYSFGVLLLEILSGRKAIDMQYEESNVVEWAVPLIKSGDAQAILDPILKLPAKIDALRKIANVACKCVRMRGKDRPSMDKVTTALERALVLLMGSPCNAHPILPTEVVLGSSRLHKKSSQKSSHRSNSETETEDQRFESRAPSWITFPRVASSQRTKWSMSDGDGGGDGDGKNIESKNLGSGFGDVLRCLDEEIIPASPQETLFLKHNF